MTAPNRQSIALADGRTLTIEVDEAGEEVALRVAADGESEPSAPLVLPGAIACVVGIALQHASAIAGQRRTTRQAKRVMAEARRSMAGAGCKARR